MIVFDDAQGFVAERTADGRELARHALDTPEAFEMMSKAWLRAGWDVKYVYSFTWFGRPIIQLPEDMIRLQEVIWALQPDVIVETGVAHGGSLVFYASLLKAMGRTPETGRVIGVEIALRDHNRAAILAHPLAAHIELVDGSSTAPDTVADVAGRIAPGQRVLVILDSNHTKAHVLDECRAYAPLVPVGSYIVATDGIMQDVAGAPRTTPEWVHDNPKAAAHAFVAENPDFVIEEPAWPFNEGAVRARVTYWPSAFLKRVR
jgi:cephalosporin hydroxylase